MLRTEKTHSYTQEILCKKKLTETSCFFKKYKKNVCFELIFFYFYKLLFKVKHIGNEAFICNFSSRLELLIMHK